MDEKDRQRFVRLSEYAAALEIELARCTFKYGMTEEAFRLLGDSPLKEVPYTDTTLSRPRRPSKLH